MEGIKYMNLVKIVIVVIEIWGIENGNLAFPITNTIASGISFLAIDTTVYCDALTISDIVVIIMQWNSHQISCCCCTRCTGIILNIFIDPWPSGMQTYLRLHFIFVVPGWPCSNFRIFCWCFCWVTTLNPKTSIQFSISVVFTCENRALDSLKLLLQNVAIHTMCWTFETKLSHILWLFLISFPLSGKLSNYYSSIAYTNSSSSLSKSSS